MAPRSCEGVARGTGLWERAAVGDDRRVGHFRSDDARDGYLTAYDRALAAWPSPPVTRDIGTSYGVTRVSSLGPPTGVPIVLLHAVAVASPLWFVCVAALAERHPVHALDTITDAGRSTQTLPVRSGADLATWVDEVLTGLAIDRAHLVGLSYGGWLALNQAVRSPDHVASCTAIDPPGALGPPRVAPMMRMVPDAFRAKVGKSDAALHRLLASLNNGEPPPQPVLDLAVGGLRSFRLKQPAPRRLRDAQLGSIRAPTLLLLSADSPVTHAARAAPNSRWST